MDRKIVLIVMDSVGIGELPDAERYGDKGSHTLKNIINYNNGLLIPNLVNLGIGNIQGIDIPYKADSPAGCFGKANEQSAGKDTTTGHWEIAGLNIKKPFPVYPDGFPDEIIIPFTKKIGKEILWNKPASGSEIINKLGDIHVETGKPIVYTSADSVFQIAAHEKVVPLEALYEYCRIARKLLQGEHGVGRVIARPFLGTSGEYYRTEYRKDFSLPPTGKTMLDIISEKGLDVVGIGKIYDIFAGRGITKSIPTKGNEDGVNNTIKAMQEDFTGLIFVNLVDFDMKFGHRNNAEGYGRALEEFDKRIPDIISALGENDILIITADHGCDPTTASTDHSREYIPILVYGNSVLCGVDLGVLDTFSDIGATVLDLFGMDYKMINGTSFKDKILK